MGTRSKGPFRKDAVTMSHDYKMHPFGEKKPARRIRRAKRDRYTRSLELRFSGGA